MSSSTETVTSSSPTNYFLPSTSFLYPLVRDYIGWKNSMGETLSNILTQEPNNVMARVIELGSELLRTDLFLDSEIYLKKLNFLKELKTENQIEILHIKALEAWREGRYNNATEIWEELLKIDALDLIALKFAHDAYFYLGQSHNICNSVERHLNIYEQSDNVPMELYGYFMGMLAFGLEEVHRYEEAMKAGIKAIEINQDDAWALHAIAHINEMRGDIVKGIEFMKLEQANWSNCQALACHMWWHLCLYYMDQGKKDEILQIYDEKISNFIDSIAPLDLVDASALLYRLYLEGMIEKDDFRWEKIRNIWKNILTSHALSFNDAHITMVFNNRQLHDKEINLHIQSLENYVKNVENENNTCKNVHLQVGIPICKAINAFNENKYDETIQLMYDIIINGKTPLIGGSNAQRDLFELIFLHAIFNSTSNKENQSIAKNLIDKRIEKKPHSGQNQRLVKRFENAMNH